MKIKLIPKSFDAVMSEKHFVNKKPIKQTAFFRNLMKSLSKKDLADCNFTYETEGMERLGADEPCLILMNHSSFTDLEIIATIFSKRQYHIVTTLDGFVGKEWLLNHLGCIPARKFITDMPLVKDILYCFKDLKSSVVMYPEASYSFDGTATDLPESVGKCLKMFRVPVVMVTTTGAFHRDPLYNCLQKRDVKVSAKVKYLLSPEEIKEKSVKELNRILKEEFSFDHWRWQRETNVKITEPFRADGLHRVLYRCPICQKERGMEGKGTKLTCSHCKTTWELKEDGALIPEKEGLVFPKGDYDFSYVSDWYRWERDVIRKEITDGKYYLDIPVDIVAVTNTKAAYEIGEGRLTHSKSGFDLEGCDGKLSFSLTARQSYSLYADYYWYEIGDMVSIGSLDTQYYCFPKDKTVNVAKLRLATEELYKLNIGYSEASGTVAL